MIDRTHALPLTRQAAALGISRGAIYYEPRPVPVGDLGLMRRLDALHLAQPAAGARLLRRLLAVLRVAFEDAPQLGEVVRVLVDARGGLGVRREYGDGHGVLVDVEAEIDDTG